MHCIIAILFALLFSITIAFVGKINSNILEMSSSLTRIEKQIKDINYKIEPHYITHSDTITFKANVIYSVSEPKK